MLEDIQKVYREYSDGTINATSNARIGRYFFFPGLIKRHYNGKLPKKLTILDVACGGVSEHPMLYASLKNEETELTLIGVDINERMINLAKRGLVSYPIDGEFQVDKYGKVSIAEEAAVYFSMKGLFPPESISQFFYKWNVDEQSDTVLHIDEEVNLVNGRWCMNSDSLSRLQLICADAVNLPFKDDFADVVIAENFLFGRKDSLSERINRDLSRVLKPGGLYLGDIMHTFF